MARMRMPALFTFVFLLTASAALAADYYVVFADGAPVSDAVTGSNFAGTMQARMRVSFTSAIDTEVYANPEAFEGKTLVFIEGQSVRIVAGGRPDVASEAESYFRDLAFDVEEAELSDLAGEDVPDAVVPEVNVTAPRQPENVTSSPCYGCDVVGECLSSGERRGLEVCVDSEMAILKPSGDLCTRDYECETSVCMSGYCSDMAPPLPPEEEETPRGVFARIAAWFRGLF